MSPAIRSGDIVSVGEVLREGLPCMGRTGQRPRYLKTEDGVEVHLHADAIRNGTGFAT